jgi:hypothetical protein
MRLFYIFLIAVPLSLSCREAGELKPDTSSDTDPDADTSETAAPPADTADSGVTETDTAGDTGTTADTGDSGTVVPFDEDGDGYTVIDGDCDDDDPAVHPGADELCDRVDNDCDTEIDEEAVDATASYPDLDADGFGDDRFIDFSCEPPPGYVVTGGDCNDTSVSTYPGATERCDDEDNDCDDEIDEGVMYTWYADSDGDGYGDGDAAIDACDPGPGYVATATDCDDVDPMSHPGAFEICDGIDNDCDAEIDDSAIDATDWHPDADTDGYGADSPTVRTCEAPSAHVAEGGDCNDADAAVHPGAVEVCDEADTDEDCSGYADDADGGVVSAGTTLWYPDADTDGFGSPTSAVARCDAPEGYIATGLDCDDTRATVNPDGMELCNDLDDDCDGMTDEDDATDAPSWYADYDGDGYGHPDITARACSAPSSFVMEASDCNDSDASINPSAAEACNGYDDNCDTVIDGADSIDLTTWYYDADGDGYGTEGLATEACDAPADHTDTLGDCNDADPETHPGAYDVCGEDKNCDGIAGDGLNITVEGIGGDLTVCTPCEIGDYSCQAQNVCDSLTGETCAHQEYDCATGTQGAWYPPSHGGGSNFNFAYAYDFYSGDYGNICDCSGVSASYGIGSAHDYCGTGHWVRR